LRRRKKIADSIFQTDIQALIFIGLIGAALYIILFIIKIIFERTEKIPISRKNKINFILRIIAILIVIYLIIDGFPSFSSISPEVSAIITGSISTALAFATSGIFSNVVAGILLWMVDPFDIGDIVKIQNFKGIIRSMTLTKIVLETFDQILIELSNSDVISSTLRNYTIKLKTRKKFYLFKKQVKSPQDVGIARLDLDVYENQKKKQEEDELKEIFEIIKTTKEDVVHSYLFTMRVPYQQFRKKVEELNKICLNYREIFGYTPHFHVIGFSNEVTVKFRILTLDSNKVLKHQPDFAKDLYKIILKSE
jgi:hypothetical protein